MRKNNGESITNKEDKFDISKYYWEENRLKSFTNWPFGDEQKCNPRKMAQAGFYACGNEDETDLAKCYFCDKELDGWESDDDPWLEHSKHSKNCMFLKYNRAEEDLTLEEHVELIIMCYERLLDKKYEEKEQKIQNEFNNTLAELKSSFKK